MAKTCWMSLWASISKGSAVIILVRCLSLLRRPRRPGDPAPAPQHAARSRQPDTAPADIYAHCLAALGGALASQKPAMPQGRRQERLPQGP